ncbi:MAG: aminoglycoside phosphotransferase family protein [Alphaproteobacteria bacterium]|nr:aminoglycoside phosphotransferase family protein [Alphaproteobacteria bacterium]
MKILSPAQAFDAQFMHDLLSRDFEIKSLAPPCKNAENTYAFEINGDTIAKFPRKESKIQKLVLERDLLNLLQGETNLKIPEPKLSDQEYFYSFYRKIPGDNIDQNQLSKLPAAAQQKFCENIASFVFKLHSLTDKVTEKIQLPEWDRFFRKYLKPNEVLEMTLNDNNFSAPEKEFLKSFYENFSLTHDRAIIKFSHFDIMPKNIAFDFDGQEIAGIYDFGDSGIGDIHFDFSQMGLHYNLETLSRIVDYYEQLSGIELDINKIWDYSFCSHAHFYTYAPDEDRASLQEQIKMRT